jgi:methylenetetrahydrofolate reductase (NADPH)
VRGLLAAPPAATAQIAGFPLFPFGGLRKAAQWLRDFQHELQTAPPRTAAPQDAAQNP